MGKALIIGIGGALTAGKDTVADYLVEQYGFTKQFMSDPLHEHLLVLNPIVAIDDEGIKYRYARLAAELGYTEMKKIPEVRRLLQVYGTELGRKRIDEDIWVNIAAKKMLADRELGRPSVITGMRYPNELHAIRRLGGILLYVDRPALQISSSHDSETSVQPSNFDFVIKNDGSLEQLFAKVEFDYPVWLEFSDAKRRGNAARAVFEATHADIWPVYDH
jgi:hypothetical protein